MKSLLLSKLMKLKQNAIVAYDCLKRKYKLLFENNLCNLISIH